MQTEPVYDSVSFNVVLLLILSLLWGSSYGLIAIGLRSFPFVTLMALRSLIACFVLFSIFSITRSHVDHSVKLWRTLMWQSLVGNTIPMLLVAWAQKNVSSATATVFGSTIPLFIFLIAVLFSNDERFSVKSFIGIGLGFVGVFIAARGSVDVFTWESFLPYAALLASSLSYAVAAIYAKRLAHVPSLFAAAGSMLWASFALVMMSVLFDDVGASSFNLSSVSVVFFLGAFCTGIAFWILFKIRNSLGPIVASAQVYLRLPVGVVFGACFLGERISSWTALGFAFIGLGVFMMVFPAAWVTRMMRLLFR